MHAMGFQFIYAIKIISEERVEIMYKNCDLKQEEQTDVKDSRQGGKNVDSDDENEGVKLFYSSNDCSCIEHIRAAHKNWVEFYS